MSRTQLDYLSVVLLNITIPAVLIWKYYSGEISEQVVSVSGVVTALIANGFFLAAIRFRLKRSGNQLSRHLIALSALLGATSAGGTALAAHLMPDQDDVLRVAYSTKPLEEIHPEPKRLFVKLVRRREQLSADYGRLAATMKPMSPALYSVQSFAAPEAVRSTETALKQAVDADLKYFDQRQQATDEFRVEMKRVDPNSDYLTAWEETAKREEAFAALEKDWVSSVVALYEYVLTHANDVKLRGDQLAFANEAERADFDRQMQASRKLNESFQASLQKSLAEQKRARADAGIEK